MSDFYTMNESENNINYYKNILTLIFGSGLSHIIPFLLTPILTRLYSTSEYGLFGFFISLIAISTMISTGRYHLAILLPKDENESNCIKFISITLSLLFCTLLTILIYVFFKLNLFGSLFAKTQNLIFFLPLATLSFSLFDITNYTLNRNGQYKDMSFARIFRSFSREVLSIIFGIYTWGAKGLILGSILGNVIPVAIYRNKIFNNLSHDLDNAKVILKKHKDFPMYQMPSSVLGSFSLQAPIYFFTAFYSLSIVGLFTLSTRLFSLPLSLLTASISQVFYKQISDFHNEKDYTSIKQIFYLTFKKLVLIGLPISIFLFLFSETLFHYVFGSDWATSGLFVKYLVPGFFIKFIISPLTPIFLVKGQIKILSIWKVVQFISTITTLFLCCYLINVKYIYITIMIYSIHEVIIYMLCFILQIRALKA